MKVCPRIRISTKQVSFWVRKLRFKNYNLRKPSIHPRLQGQTQVDTEKPLKKAEIRCENPEIGNTGSAEIRIIRKSANLKSIRNRSQVRKKKKQRSVHPCFRASSWRLNQSRSKVAPKPKFPACLGGKNGWALPNWNRRSLLIQTPNVSRN